VKTLLFFSQFLFGLIAIQGQGPDKIIHCRYSGVTFGAFCSDVRMQSGVTIYYKESWVSQLKVTLQSDSLTVTSAVEKVLAGTGLKVSAWHGNLVITRGEPLLLALPEFQNPEISQNAGNEVSGLTESEERYIKGRRAGDNQVIIIGENHFGSSTSKVKVHGKITEQETGEAVIGAAMFVEELETGTRTDLNGYLSIAIKPGTYTVRFEYLGYEKKTCTMQVFSSGEFSLEMKRTVIPIEEVVVIGDRQINVTSRDPGLEKISAKTVREIPTMMGERDILKVSEMLPGIVSVGEGSAGLNVRGGSSDQNAFYINKIPVYNTSHLFGFFPAFNSDIIKDFTIYKGYVPSQFGGRLSSVFNITTRQGNRKRFSMHGGINPVTASVTVEGPLVKDKSSVLLSARSSYSDWILERIKDPTIRTSSARFNDVAMSLNYDFKKTQVSLFGFNSFDFFRLSDITQYEYSNTGASMNLRRNFSADVQADLSLIAARYEFSTTNKQEVSNAYDHRYELDHYELRLDFNHATISKNSLTYGVSALINDLDRGKVLPHGESSLRSPVLLGRERGIESSLYLGDVVDILPWLNLSVGVRYSLYAPLGPRKVYTYTEGAPRDPRYLEDSLLFGKNKALKWYSSPEIRATLNIETDPQGSLKLAFNQMHQSVFMLNNTISVAPNTQWKLADYYLVPARSEQVSMGMFRNFPKGGWETSMELYYKNSHNFPEFRDGADFLDGSPVESQVLQGEQKSYGIELSLKRSGRKLDGWMAYTYSRAIARVDGGEAWNSINGGESYPSSFDIPHALNALLNYHVSRRFSISTVITYQSGRPITYPLSVYYINGVPFTDYSKRNKYNIPDYFRTDLSATIEGNLKRDKLIHSSLVFSVYNLTGRNNPYSVYFKTENGKLNSYKYSVIGVPFYTITWLFKLGNYASE
jgi:hypothetical protein